MFIVSGVNSEFIKIFGDMTLVMVTDDYNLRRFRLIGAAIQNWGKDRPFHYLDPERALTLLEGVEERTRDLHAKSLERELKRIAEVKVLLRGKPQSID